MIRKFIEGHKYIYLGITKPIDWQYAKGNMDFALLPQVLTCKICKGDDVEGDDYCNFIEDENKYAWFWGEGLSPGLDKWIDVTKMPDEKIQEILAEKKRRMVAERI